MSALTKPCITIGIATFNRATVLARALQSLCELEPSDSYETEVVVIDNGSTDETKSVVEEFSKRLGCVRWVYEPRAGLPFARNRAVKEARGDWIAFFDDDQLADPQWLKLLYERAVIENVGCVGGARSLLIEADLPTPLPAYSRSLLGEIDFPKLHDYHAGHLPCTGNVLIAKQVFDRVGGFDDNVLDGGEDTDFFNRVIQAGIRAVYDPRAKVEHIIAPRRLERDYLESIAYRHGRHVCRRDILQRGFLFGLSSAILRSSSIGCLALIQKTWFQLLGEKHRAISAACSSKRVRGYWSYLITHRNANSSEVSKTMHRGKG